MRRNERHRRLLTPAYRISFNIIARGPQLIPAVPLQVVQRVIISFGHADAEPVPVQQLAQLLRLLQVLPAESRGDAV